jgi:hypothetical protein
MVTGSLTTPKHKPDTKTASPAPVH